MQPADIKEMTTDSETSRKIFKSVKLNKLNEQLLVCLTKHDTTIY